MNNSGLLGSIADSGRDLIDTIVDDSKCIQVRPTKRFSLGREISDKGSVEIDIPLISQRLAFRIY